jgi:pyruvate carboxylase subunit B
MSVIDTNVLMHQIPGGMLTNLVSQLKEAGALDRIREVYEELPKTRKDMGYPPLVTPSSQIVGIQAVQNVLFGRYNMTSAQIKDYAYGLYGRPPVPMDPEVQKKVLKGYERGETPITCRPADILEPELKKAEQVTKGLAKGIGDVLIYALYPTTGERFLKWKYGVEPPPASVKPKTIEDVKREDELIAKAKAGRLMEKPEKPAPPKGPGLKTFNVFVDGEYFAVEVEDTGGTTRITEMRTGGRVSVSPPQSPEPPGPAEKGKPVFAKPQTELAAGEVGINAPMPGMIISYNVKAGDKVKTGDIIIVLEAMKMQNNLTSPVDGVVKSVHFNAGSSVMKGDLLCVISTQ